MIIAHIRHAITSVTLYSNIGTSNVSIAGLAFGIQGVPTAPLPKEVIYWSSLIEKYLDGRMVSLSDLPLDFSLQSEFRTRVCKSAQKIPFGTTVSYAGLAQLAGVPRAIRAVASVMRNNAFPLIVPCHRVVRSDGTIGGFMGNQEGRTIGLKQQLISLERDALLKKE